MSKVCYKCKEIKDLESFHKDKSRPDGRRAICRNCVIEKNITYYDANVGKISEQKSEWFQRTFEERSKTRKAYYYNNRPAEIKRSYLWNLKKIKEDDFFRLIWNLRSRHRSYFKLQRITKKNKGLFLQVGLTPADLRRYIESQFTSGMTWENYGKWHVDHVVPLSTAKTEEEVIKLFHYTNLQPLWAADNLKKGSKILPQNIL